MKIIDSHIHVGLQSFCQQHGANNTYDLCNTYENTITLMDQYDVERAVILPIPSRSFDIKLSNKYVYEAYLNFPNRFIPFCRIDDLLETNLANGFRGVKLHLLYEDLEIKLIKRELQIIEDAGTPLLLHALFKDKVKQIEKILKWVPNIKIILAHMGRGNLYTGEQVVENAIGLKQYTNVFFDTSTVGDVKSIVKACEIVGYDRILFGSDYPFGKSVFKEKYEYGDELSLFHCTFKQEQINKIMRDNLLGLLDQGSPDSIHIRRIKKTDLDGVVTLIEQLSETDRKYLALSSKYSLIKSIIRSERHCYIAHLHGEIVGFIRESGRPDGYSLLEEIVVSPKYRNKGIGKTMLCYYHNVFHKNIAKTNTENTTIIHLLQKNGYTAENPEAPRIINWIRNREKTS